MPQRGESRWRIDTQVQVEGRGDFDPEQVHKTRDEELSKFSRIELPEEVPQQESWKAPRNEPVRTKSVDAMKDSDRQRQAAVCQGLPYSMNIEITDRMPRIILAATPCLETLKSLLTTAHRNGLRVLVQNVQKAQLDSARSGQGTASTSRGRRRGTQEAVCWKVRRWQFGRRQAARAGDEDYAERLRGGGMDSGGLHRCVSTARPGPRGPWSTG